MSAPLLPSNLESSDGDYETTLVYSPGVLDSVQPDMIEESKVESTKNTTKPSDDEP